MDSYVDFEEEKKKKKLRRPGIEPGSTAWKAAMLTTIPPTPVGMERAAKGNRNECDEDWVENRERERG